MIELTKAQVQAVVRRARDGGTESMLPLDGAYMGVADVARLLGMKMSTTYRYIKTLLAVGLLECDLDSGKYRIAGIG